MTLQQAFTEWAASPQNATLAARARTPVLNVLLKDYGERDIRVFSAGFVEKLVESCPESHAHKVKAVSVLIHTLLWASKQGYCNKPDFDYTIVSDHVIPSEKGNAQPEAPAEHSSSATVAEDTPSQDRSGRFVKGMKPLNAGKHVAIGGRPKIPVSQLDPETLQVIASFDSMADAERNTGTHNVYRAVRGRKIENGYFWCRAGEEKDFKPGYVRSPRKKATRSVRKEKPTEKSSSVCGRLAGGRGSLMQESDSPGSTTQAPLFRFSDADLCAELERRGWCGTLSKRMELTPGFQQQKQEV